MLRLLTGYQAVPSGGLIHSDQDAQFTSIYRAAFLKAHAFEHSMNRAEAVMTTP